MSDQFCKYLTLSDREILWGNYVTGAGSHNAKPGDNYPAGIHPSKYHFMASKGRVLQEFQLLYISSGQGYFESKETGKIEIQAGDAFMLFPGVWHHYHPNPKTGWNEYFVSFDGENYRNYLKQGWMSKNHPRQHVGYDEKWIGHYRNILHLIQLEPIGFQQEIATHAGTLVAKYLTKSRKEVSGGSEVDQKIKKAKCVLLESVQGPIDIQKLAGELDMDYDRFRRVFKSHTGLSPYQYHLQLKINRAKELLSDDKYSIKEISYQLAFENPHYFSRIFKKKTRLSPLEWRKQD